MPCDCIPRTAAPELAIARVKLVALKLYNHKYDRKLGGKRYVHFSLLPLAAREAWYAKARDMIWIVDGTK